MTPAEFAREVVIPTVEDFRSDRTSRRWAYLSAIAVYHLRDHLAEALAPLTGEPKADRRAVSNTAERIDDAVQSTLPSPVLFDTVRAVANGTKHALTRSPRGVTFTAGSDQTRTPALYGMGGYGAGVFQDAGGREIPHGGKRIDLYQAIAATLSAFLRLYPEHLGGCTFEPHEPEA